MVNGKYVYCFIEGKIDAFSDITGIGSRGKVYFIEHDGISAAVSDTPFVTLEPNRENALAHEKTIQQLLKNHNLVPCSFGNIFKSRDDIVLFISRMGKYIKDNLDKVRGMMEVGLRVFWKKGSFTDEIETKEIKDFRNMLEKRTDPENYYSRIELGKMVEMQVSKRRDYYAEHIFKPLSRISKESKLNDAVNPMMVLNAAFLISKEREQEFDTQVGAVMKKYGDKLDFSYSGPWPPYNFSTVAPEA